MQFLYKLDNLITAEVIKRPSLYVKSPYVSDVKLPNDDTTDLAHSPSLGCCGLADAGATVLLMKSNSKTKPKNELGLKCEYTIYLSKIERNIYVGIHPKLAEKLVELSVKSNYIKSLQNVKYLKSEISIYIKDKIDSRFDFTGLDSSGIPFIMEVKNVPLADYEDCDKKVRAKMDFSNRDFNSKVAYFPDGYRKTTYEPVSPRALKHIKELTYLKKEKPDFRCIMCYVIQRTDVNRFTPSVIDHEYRNAFIDAQNSGVEIITLVIKWTENGEAYFIRDDLPIDI
jgi:DNA-binding sugar fermentation-stimulating protein